MTPRRAPVLPRISSSCLKPSREPPHDGHYWLALPRFVVFDYQFDHQLKQVGPDGRGGGLCSLDDAEAGACPAANQFFLSEALQRV